MTRHIAFAVLALASLAGCSGRDPAVSKNDDAHIEPPPPPPPPPPVHVRTLAHTGKLFGTMPVDNRFQDPLMTFTGTGWFAYENDFQSNATVFRLAGASPTNTQFLQIPAEQNPHGATIIGQLKTKAAPIHVEVWVGRDGDTLLANDVDAEFAGLFADGEQAIPMAADKSSVTTLDNRIWERFTADVDTGPVGWADLLVTDTSSSPTTLYVGGAVGVDVDPNAHADFISSKMRALTKREHDMMDAVRERTRTTQTPPALVPSALPGLPPVH